MTLRTKDSQFDLGHGPDCLLERKKLELMTSDQLDGLLASVIQQKATGDATWLLARRSWLESMDMTAMVIREQLNLTKHAELSRSVDRSVTTPMRPQAIASLPVTKIGRGKSRTKVDPKKQRLLLARQYIELTSTASVTAIADTIHQMSDGELDVSHTELQAELEGSGLFVFNGRMAKRAVEQPSYFVYR